jgi:hypothetical protein
MTAKKQTFAKILTKPTKKQTHATLYAALHADISKIDEIASDMTDTLTDIGAPHVLTCAHEALEDAIRDFRRAIKLSQ